ncbi:DUF4055 domain-containing protein [Roseobacter sp. OBYS 0001]|uniref:DUF4055 domain-containing protein n=1 Tax=Roseobacter sp. OBYS 0001 TaxID=882651 RepID=UPI001BC7F2B0|nr:DUF4055 domain-containing protein [Roseobacter sp. OBYS 0001]GIT86171.1 hypothetical protein ROBYS_11870 [Roseobacter sp. OBYS 0001]
MKIQHRTYDTRLAEYNKIRDVIEGEDRLKKQGELYLRRPEGMSQKAYSDYVKGAAFYAVAERTLRGMVGAATRNRPIVELPRRIESMRNVATFDGNTLETLIEDSLREVLSIGRYALLLDFPSQPENSLAVPHISPFNAEAILDWREELHDGKNKLTMLRLYEDNEDLDDSGVEQHLVLTLEPAYTVRRVHVTRRPTGDGRSQVTEEQVGQDIIPTVNGSPLFDIPAVIISAYNLKIDVEKPPFLDLVNVNLAHWRGSADYEHALYRTSQPTPWIAGNVNAENKPEMIGAGAFWILPEGATAGMLEFTGAGIAAQKEAMDDKVAQMATLGARMVYDGKGRNETSDTAKLRHRSELSLLHSSVNMVEAGIVRLLRIAAEWTQPNTADQVSVQINRDFITAQMDPAVLTALLKAWQSGAISHDTFLMNLKKGELMDVARSLDDEKDMIEEDEAGQGLVLPFTGA